MPPKKGSNPSTQLVVSVARKGPSKQGKQGGKKKGTKRRSTMTTSRTGPKYSNARSLGNSHMAFTGSGQNSIRVRGEEIFETVRCAQYWTPYSYVISPANYKMFPRLVSLARMFEEWKIHGLRIHYIPACPTTRSGSVVGCIDYDCTDPPPASIREAAANVSFFCGSVGLGESLTFKSTEQAEEWYFSEPAVGTNTAQLRQYSPGALHVAMSEASSGDLNAVAGYLVVEYDIAFSGMRPPVNLLGSYTTGSVGTNLAATAGAITPLPYTPLDSVGFWGTDPGNNTNVVNPGVATTTGKAILLHAGKWLVNYVWSWASGAITSLNESRRDSGYLTITAPSTPRKEEEKKVSSKKVLSSVRSSLEYEELKQVDGVMFGRIGDTWSQCPVVDESKGITGSLTAGDVEMMLSSVIDGAVSTGSTTVEDKTINAAGAVVDWDRSVYVSLTQPTWFYGRYNIIETRNLVRYNIAAVRVGPSTDT